MKILLLIDSLGVGGAETHVYDLARELSRVGHSVTVASCGGELARNLRACGVRHIKMRFFVWREAYKNAIFYSRSVAWTL